MNEKLNELMDELDKATDLDIIKAIKEKIEKEYERQRNACMGNIINLPPAIDK